MKRFLSMPLVAFAPLFFACLQNGSDTIVLPNLNREGLPSNIIPDAIRDEIESSMPIYTGKNPPDISGQYMVSPYETVRCGDGFYAPGRIVADGYVAFIKKSNGKLSYREKQGGGTSGSDDVIVEIVGAGNNFTAFFIADGTYGNATYRMSTVVSGTLTSGGIKDFHIAIIMLEKNDPSRQMMDVNVYRTFKDGDGLAERYTWLP